MTVGPDRRALLALWFVEADGEVVGAGRFDLQTGTAFAGLWGGSVREDWRGRGVYRALTQSRASAAVALGADYLDADCTEMSRPILERCGLTAITTTTPYVWTESTSATCSSSGSLAG
ncbi:MAG TPA: hypothetical protein PKM36_01830 [Propionibacteriaceae bacterium]|nr:hypothetical protein [Propionibacteriaceae bacterium]HPZ48462.1 hypothetical protein [Propionibacteriaceae bacterium]